MLAKTQKVSPRGLRQRNKRGSPPRRPTTGLDALGAGEELEIALIARIAVPGDEALRAKEEPGGTKTGDRPRFSARWKTVVCPRFFPIPFRAVIVRERDAEDAIAPEPRGQSPDKALAVDRLFLRAGKPGRLARHIRQERIGTQRQADRGSGEDQAVEPFARDDEDEIGLALGRREVELEPGRGLAQVLEQDSSRCTPAPCPRSAPSNSTSMRRSGKSSACIASVSAGTEPRLETRRRNMRLARIDDAPTRRSSERAI